VPVQLSETPGEIRSAAPLLGADTARVLEELLGVKPSAA
jgi:crotonobetainyl-CoA:carnitine CoA-transferase CaiB-like acyl-CoA transferase